MAIRVPRRNLLQIGTRAAGRPIRSEAEVLSMPRVDLIGAVSSGQPDVGGTINQFATNVMKLKQEADTKTRNQQITNIVTSTGEQISGMAHEAIVQFTDDYRRGKNDGDIDGDFSIQLQNKLKGRIKENTHQTMTYDVTNDCDKLKCQIRSTCSYYEGITSRRVELVKEFGEGMLTTKES